MRKLNHNYFIRAIVLTILATFNYAISLAQSQNNVLTNYDFTKKKDDKYIYTNDRNSVVNSAILSDEKSPFLEALPYSIDPITYPSFTFTAWIKTNTTRRMLLISQELVTTKDGNTLLGRNLWIENKHIYGSLGNGFTTKIPLIDGQWNFVAITYNQVDSTVITVAGNTYSVEKGFISNNSKNAFLGASILKENIYEGMLDDITIYDKALSIEDLSILSGVTLSTPKKPQSTQETGIGIAAILFILLLITYLVAICYMCYVLFVKKKPYEPIDNNVIASEANEATEEEAYTYLEEVFTIWKVVSKDEKGNNLYAPKNIKQIKQSLALLEKVRSLNPTNKDIIDKANDIGNFINSQMERVFTGSKKLIGAATIPPICLMIFIYLISSQQPQGQSIGVIYAVASLFFLPTITYIMASYTPVFLANKYTVGTSSIIGTILGVFAGIGTAAATHQTYTRVKWSDGSQTIHRDSNAGGVGAFIGIVMFWLITVLATLLISIVSVISFLRNYVWYR